MLKLFQQFVKKKRTQNWIFPIKKCQWRTKELDGINVAQTADSALPETGKTIANFIKKATPPGLTSIKMLVIQFNTKKLVTQFMNMHEFYAKKMVIIRFQFLKIVSSGFFQSFFSRIPSKRIFLSLNELTLGF